MEKKVDVFKEWTSKRPWKERKRAEKARAASPLQILEPELIFYGQHSGVIGCTRDELYQTVSDDELYTCGYDKVLLSSCPSPGTVFLFFRFYIFQYVLCFLPLGFSISLFSCLFLYC